MSNLGPQQQNISYDGILQIPGGVTAQLQQVQDGEGRNTGFWLSSSGANITTADSFTASNNGYPYSGALPRLISDGFGDYVSIKDFGASGDGVTDDSAAIQAAIDSFKSSNGYNPDKTKVLFVPEGTYLIETSIKIYSGISIVGEGRKSLFLAGDLLTGQILSFVNAASGNACTEIYIDKLGFSSSGSVWAIKNNAGSFGNSTLSNLVFDCGYCVSLYSAQSIVIDGLLCKGSKTNQILYLSGNRNLIKNIDKEESTGSSSDSYVLLDNAIGDCSGNILENILIEGTTSVNKYAISLTNASNTIFSGVWIEPTTFNGNISILLTNCNYIYFYDYHTFPYSTNNKISVVTSANIVFDTFNCSNEDVSLSDDLVVDSTSFVRIKSLITRRGNNTYILDNLARNIKIDQQFVTTDNVESNGYSRVSTVNYSGSNALINASFDAGLFAWSCDGTVSSAVVSASEVAFGNMLTVTVATASTWDLYTTAGFTVTSGMIGKPITFTCLVKVNSTEGGWVSCYAYGAGVSSQNGYPRARIYNSWQLITLTAIPTTTGNIKFGVTATNLTSICVDEASLCFGTIAQPNKSAFGSIEINNNTHASASAAPSTGTWKVGDIVYNTAPTSGGYAGWICTVAGTPGTWKTFGLIS